MDELKKILEEKDAEISALKAKVEELESVVEFWSHEFSKKKDAIDAIRLILKMGCNEVH